MTAVQPPLQIQRIIQEQQLATIAAITDHFQETLAVKVKHHAEHGLLLFMYDQQRTDFALRGASECRGTILRDAAPHDAVCVPFFKFFNIDEPRAAALDWNTARVYEKLDGSIIKVYWHRNEWLVATNGTIDARTTPVFNDVGKERTFYDLFRDALPDSFDWSALSRDCTYMFELMHPMQLIVVEHAVPRLVHIGTRNNVTLVESYERLPLQTLAPPAAQFVEQARSFSLASRAACIAAAAQLGADQEGFVAVDAAWNRVKIKGPVYVALHHAGTGSALHGSPRQCAADIFLHGETDEVRAYRLGSARLATISTLIDEIEVQFKAALTVLQQKFVAIRKEVVQSKKENCATQSLQKLDRKAFALAAGAFCKKNKTAFAFLMQCAAEEIEASTVDEKSIARIVLEKFQSSKASKQFLQFLDEMKIF